ncbi:MAG: ATP-binding protein [Spirochaetes bacterium]|nr:ATP-binding protein [Spirochaetota bacterium]MBN2771337.1 ATP-binding protein [Spirochaetota bacterium]
MIKILDHNLNIVFPGAPGTGKTTLCEALAKKFNTKWMPEYGREYWEKNQVERRLSELQLLEIAKGHLEIEDRYIYESEKFLFTDTNAITTYMFSKYYHNTVSQELSNLAKIAEKRYDLIFYVIQIFLMMTPGIALEMLIESGFRKKLKMI